MSMYIRETNGVVPISLDKSQLSIYGKLYNERTLPGITANSSLNDIVERKLLPDMSSIALWINERTKYGQEVRRDTRDGSLYGHLIISRYQGDYHLRAWSLDRPVIYLNAYSTVNDRGWWNTWYQVQLKAVS